MHSLFPRYAIRHISSDRCLLIASCIYMYSTFTLAMEFGSLSLAMNSIHWVRSGQNMALKSQFLCKTSFFLLKHDF